MTAQMLLMPVSVIARFRFQYFGRVSYAPGCRDVSHSIIGWYMSVLTGAFRVVGSRSLGACFRVLKMHDQALLRIRNRAMGIKEVNLGILRSSQKCGSRQSRVTETIAISQYNSKSHKLLGMRWIEIE
jgi:hypothetical protein